MRVAKYIYQYWTLQRLNDEIKKRKTQEKTARIKRIIADLENEKITRL